MDETAIPHFKNEITEISYEKWPETAIPQKVPNREMTILIAIKTRA